MAEEIKKPKKGLAKWIAGGVLTAVAAGTFVAVSPNFNHKQEANAAKPIATVVAEGKTEETIPVENGLTPPSPATRNLCGSIWISTLSKTANRKPAKLMRL